MELNFEKELQGSKQFSLEINKATAFLDSPKKCIFGETPDQILVDENQKLVFRFEDTLKNPILLNKVPELLSFQTVADERQIIRSTFEGVLKNQKLLLKHVECLKKKEKELELKLESLKEKKKSLNSFTRDTRKALQTAVNSCKKILKTNIKEVDFFLSASTFKVMVQFISHESNEATINLIVERCQRKIIGFEAAPTRPLTQEEWHALSKYLEENSKNLSGFGTFIRSLLLKL